MKNLILILLFGLSISTNSFSKEEANTTNIGEKTCHEKVGKIQEHLSCLQSSGLCCTCSIQDGRIVNKDDGTDWTDGVPAGSAAGKTIHTK